MPSIIDRLSNVRVCSEGCYIDKREASSQVAHTAGAYPGFDSIKRLGIFLLPPGWDASRSQGTSPQHYFAGTYSYTWVEWGTMRVKCLAYKHNTPTPTRAQTRTVRRGARRANHKATAPSILYC